MGNIQETRARGAHVIAIATDGNEDIAICCWCLLMNAGGITSTRSVSSSVSG